VRERLIQLVNGALLASEDEAFAVHAVFDVLDRIDRQAATAAESEQGA
jgi:hypothetical protein